MTEVDRLAQRLAPAIARAMAMSEESRPRPDLHADHDRRLTAIETTLSRVLDSLEKLASIDARVAEIEASRRAEAAAYEARRAERADRWGTVKWLVATIPTTLITASVLFYTIGQAVARGQMPMP